MGLTVEPNCSGTCLFTAWGEHTPLSTTSKDARKLLMQLAEKAPSLYPFMYMNDVNTDTFLGRIVDALLSSGEKRFYYKTITFDQRIFFYPQAGRCSSPCHAIYTLNYPKSRMSARFKALLFAYRPDTFVTMRLVKYPVPRQPVAFTREEQEVLGQFFDILIGPSSYGHRSDDLAGYLAHTGLQFEEPVQSPGLFITDMNTGLPYPSIPNDTDWKGDIRFFTKEGAIKAFGDDPTKPKVELSRTPQEAIDAGKREAERPKVDALQGQSQNQATQHNEVSTQSIASKQAVDQQASTLVHVTPSSDKVDVSNSTKSSNSHGDVVDEGPYAGTARNAPCPCGSGKKYKYCHGKVVKNQQTLQVESAIEQQNLYKTYFATLLDKAYYTDGSFDWINPVLDDCVRFIENSNASACVGLIEAFADCLNLLDSLREVRDCVLHLSLTVIKKYCGDSTKDALTIKEITRLFNSFTDVAQALWRVTEVIPTEFSKDDAPEIGFIYGVLGGCFEDLAECILAYLRPLRRDYDCTDIVSFGQKAANQCLHYAYECHYKTYEIEPDALSCRYLADVSFKICLNSTEKAVRSAFLNQAITAIDESLTCCISDTWLPDSWLPDSLETACKIYKEAGDARYAETLRQLLEIDPGKAKAFL